MKMNKPVLVIRYDGGKPRNIECNGRLCSRFTDKYGNHIYVIEDTNIAGRLVSMRPDRWRLFKSRSFDFKLNKVNGTVEWLRPVPWSYREVTRDVGHDERGERKFKTVLEWFEDKEEKFVIEPTEEAITGNASKATISVQDELNSALKENAKLKDIIAGQDKKMAELDRKLDALSSQISGIPDAIRPVGRPKKGD
jgi:hypothetical protein